MRILLVEDDLKIASFVIKGMKEAGFVVEHVTDGNHGLNLALAETFDAAIIDIMLPGRDGLSIIDELRHRNINLPVIILSARRSVDDRVKGFQTGGDDLACLLVFVQIQSEYSSCSFCYRLSM